MLWSIDLNSFLSNIKTLENKISHIGGSKAKCLKKYFLPYFR